MLGYILTTVIGVAIGIVLCIAFIKTKTCGMLYFYDQEPGESPVMVAELNEQVEDVRKLTCAIFKVSHK